MARTVGARLGGLMFLQYFMMGAWFVPFGSYMSKGLRFDGVIGLAYGSQGIAAIVSTVLVGALADRVFALERLLATLFLLAAVALFGIAAVTSDVRLFLLLVFLHFLFFIPTIPLATALCLRWLPDPPAHYPRIRVLGTVGWILSGWVVGGIAGATESRLPLLIAGTVGVALAGYALTLPPTPPQRRAGAVKAADIPDLLGITVIRRFATRRFYVFIGATFMIMLPMAFYYAYFNNFLVESGATFTLGGQRFEGTAIQSLGQVSELLFLLLLPSFLRVAGIKGVFLLGLASWTVRYCLFAAAVARPEAAMALIVAGVLLHGIANDFIQVAGQLFVDESFPAEARARAQAFFTSILMGVGALVGSGIANMVYATATIAPAHHDWVRIWSLPALAACVTALWFAASFRTDRLRSAGR